MSAGKHAFQAELVDIRPGDTQLLNEVIALGDRYSKTLGFLPYPVFAQAAEARTLVAAIRNAHVVGYVLYNLPRQAVRLRQLCVSEDARGCGIALTLVEAISERHSDRYGIALKCRTDFQVNGIWPHLGFELQGQVRGRSRQGLPLSVWWRDHGHPNLFSAPESLGLVRVALDHNVFLDLEFPAGRRGADESAALAADWLADQADLMLAPELEREIARLPNDADRSRQRQAARRYRSITVDANAADAMANNITEHVKRNDHLDLSTDTGDRSDARHLAEAALGGVTVLASRDEKFLTWSASVVDVTGVRVMRPHDVILQLDELAQAQAYRPLHLQHTGYRLVPVRSGAEQELLTFLHTSEGERKADYLSHMRNILAAGRRWNPTILRSPDGKPIAFYAVGTEGGELVVPLFRIATSRLEETVTRQLLFLMRDRARREGKVVVRITEPLLAKETQRIAREEGFIKVAGNWVCLVVRACGDAGVVDGAAALAAQSVGLRLPTLCTGLSSVIAADLERTIWPAKIIDSELPTYIVPIKPNWSAELFGVPQSLMPRPNMIGLSREHVYYRSPIPLTPAPSRLLWYVTDAKDGGVAAVIACSRLDEAVVDKPAFLYQRFRHLGVWQRDQVTNAAKRDQIQALRFSDTELFPHFVSLRRLKQLAIQYCQRIALRSPQKISSELFAALYQEGQSAGDGT
jgi:hypothetical protein